MKLKILLIPFLLFQINIGFAQICSTSESANTNQTIKKNKKLSRQSPVCINIVFHIVRDDNGNGNSDVNEDLLESIINILNSDFNIHGISLASRGYDYIDNTTIYQSITNENQVASLIQPYNIAGAINYYIVNNLWSNNIAGTAVTIPSQNLVIRRDQILSAFSSHEVGHCLGLYHTYHGTAAGSLQGCLENINGSNCEDCGDKVCDTPADNATGNNNGYTPDLNNIMSLYENKTQFTSGQADRMLNTINNNSLINEMVSLSCEIPTLTNIDFLCYPNPQTFSIANLDNDSVTWQISSNLQIESSTTNSINIEPIGPLTSGLGWVQATLSTGYILKDYFWIGKPSAVDLVILSSGAFNISTQRWYQLTAHHQNYDFLAHGNLTYEWQIPYAQLRMSPPKNKVISVFPTQTGTYPYKLRSKNDCGCSDWVTEFFTIATNPGDDDLYISRTGN